jgi:hypothetical protein
MVNISDTDPGFRNLIASLHSLEDKKLKVGVLPSAGRNSEGVDLVDVAVWNEFGTRHIPARPFMRIAADKNENKWNRYAERCVDAALKNRANINNALNLLGEQVKSDVQRVFGSGELAPNKASTIRRKGSSKPLIDHGDLRRSIGYMIGS